MNREEWNIEQEKNEQACKHTRITALESQVKALTEKNEGHDHEVWTRAWKEASKWFVQVKELVDSVRAFTATEDRTMTKREHERLKQAVASLKDNAYAADFLAKRDREVEARVWREAMLLSEQKLDDQYNVVYKVFEAKAAESKP